MLHQLDISSFFIAFTYLIFSHFCEASIPQNSSDKLALIDIKSHLIPQYPDDASLSSWNESLDFCFWAGIECSKRHHRVTAVTLKGMNLYGDIAPSLANLSFLHHLDLSLNSLGGRIPPQLGQLARLRHLNLSFNFLTGEIPPNLCSCSNLAAISLDHNYLRYHIPKELGLLRKLEKLHLHNNNLTGTLPPSLGNLSLVEEIDVSYNQLEGEIPESIGGMKNLAYFLLAINQFSGVFPPAIYNLSSLKLLALTENKFTGNLRSDVGFLFPNIQQLWLSGNEFHGKIPASLSNVSGIAGVDLSGNYFSGEIPSALAELQHLRSLNLYGNSLGNYSDDGLAFLDSLANCSSLEFLDVSWNYLGGRLMASVANFSSHLDSLYLEENRISGSIPEEISSLIGLTTLSMSANLLTGNIPSSIGSLPLLKNLYIGENLLMGKIPSSMGNLTQLLEFYVYNNTLQGNLPSTFSDLNQLQDARFCHNKLNGTIPSRLLTLTSLVNLNLSHNSFFGSLPSEIGNLTSITSLDVSYNHLSGEIPANLGLCLSLNTLNMEHNFFGGSVPDLSHLKGLEYLDLSRNNLTGKIPDYFVNSSLLNLNISYNDFKGHVPIIGVFKNETAVQVNGNNNLCGGIKQFNLKQCPKNSISHVNLKLILPPVLVSCFLLLFVSVMLSRRKKSSSLNKRSQSSLGRVHARISFKELYHATRGFSSDNLIGAGSFGSVYMGILGQGESETQIAVKVLNLHQKGASRSFFAECEALGNIRHRNLVKIMTVCSGVEYNGNDFKALMYPYMLNGSLDKWLHCKGERKLNLLQRVNVAVDVACALQYLHHGCHFPVIHCDLKPSNVLLDGDMTARVSDFGLARLLLKLRGGEDGLNQFSSFGIKGTFGYIAPEYGTGSPVSTQGDVYSYGILLMELFTGRRPVDGTFEDNFNLHNLVKQSLPDNVMKIIDESALLEEGGNEMMIECLVLVMGIAIACSAENPHDRINMAEVANKLADIKGRFM